MSSATRTLAIPDLSLVALVGPSGCGKSTFARAHFRPTEILSSDFFRGLVSDDENDQGATRAAFESLHFVAARRLEYGRLAVIDATNVQPEARAPLVALAREHDVMAVAIVLNIPEELCRARDEERTERNVGPDVIRVQAERMRQSLRVLQGEGFRRVHVLNTPEEVAAVRIVREPLPPDRRGDHGPFDIVGDVHGCADELEALLALLGYSPGDDGAWRHPAGRRLVFLGDLVDRGPRVPDVLRIAMATVGAGAGLCVPGNHDAKLVRALRGKNVKLLHGLDRSMAQLDEETPEFRRRVAAFLDGLPSHYVLDGGRLVVAHAGLKEHMQGRESGRIREFALYGDTTGEVDELGLPVRLDWAADYRGRAAVVYGHTPMAAPVWVNDTINIDTGCVFGGRLSALRWPEQEVVSVPARERYAETKRRFLPEDEAEAAALGPASDG